MSVTALASPSPAQVTCLPGLDELDSTRVVRFDNECILIPEQSRKRSRVVTKSYSLPLWKRRSSSSDTESADGSSSPVVPNASEDAHIVIKVPLPRFIVRRAWSPSRAQLPSQVPLTSCLVHRSPPSPVSTKHHHMLPRPSMPIHHQRKSEPIIRVPLRACCPDCVPITEECMREGEQWKVRFTRGARRRRSASLDSTTPRPSSRDGPGLSDDVAPLTRLTITVDEVDKRRRSLDLTTEDIRRHKASLLAQDDHFPVSALSCPGDIMICPSSPRLPQLSVRSSPIQEEDEDQLFPLPYPKRTPSASPVSSLNIDLSPRPSPTPSRSSSVCLTSIPGSNTSLTCFSPTPAKSGTLLDESILSQSISRKTANCEEHAIDFGSGAVPVSNEPANISCPASSASSMKPPIPSPVTPPNSPSSLVTSSSSSSPSIPKRVPSTSAAKQKRSKKPSFSIPFLKAGAGALKGASVDVLKGVSMGGAMHSLG